MHLINLFFKLSFLALLCVATPPKTNLATIVGDSTAAAVTIPIEKLEEVALLTAPPIAMRVPRDNGRISFDVFLVDLDHSELQFFHKGTGGKKIKNIKNLKSHLSKKSEKLLFATNGGMYKPNLEPEGLYIENGQQQYPLNMGKDAPGSFTNFMDYLPTVFFT